MTLSQGYALLRNGQIFMKHAQYAETDEKSQKLNIEVSKTKHRTKKLMDSKIRFITLRIFYVFVAIWIKFFPFLNDCISKNKDREIDFSFFSKYCAAIWTKKWALSQLRICRPLQF